MVKQHRPMEKIILVICAMMFILSSCSHEVRSIDRLGEEGGEQNISGDLENIIPQTAGRPTRFIRILTTQSPSVIAWGEIEVTGASPLLPDELKNVSTGSISSASSFRTAQPPSLAVDGIAVSMWNAGGVKPAWIQLDLGEAYLIQKIRLLVAQDLPGDTEHRVYFGADMESLELVHIFSEYTQHGQWLSLDIEAVDINDQNEMNIANSDQDMGGELVDSTLDHVGGEIMVAGEEVPMVDGPTVGHWRRLVLPFNNGQYEGNPFLLEMKATFVHELTGQSIEIPAYYDGNDTWKVAFMPTKVGRWSWTSTSSDAELDGHSGVLTAIESEHQGLLAADPSAPNKWHYTETGSVIPVGLFVQGMLDDASDEEFSRLAEFLSAHHFSLINFRLSEHDKAFSDVNTLTMDLALWQRLESRVEMLTEDGLGIDIMLYTDDSGRPSFAGQSEAELLLIRYMIARLASFPSVLINTGIDLVEYRDQAWVNWFGDHVSNLDPYNHPISSRYGGGSGQLIMDGQTFNSVGARNSTMSDLLTAYDQSDLVPTMNNDNWSEDLVDINGHTPADLRRAVWKAIVAGGVGFSIRHNTLYCPRGITECDRYFPINQAIELLDSGAWIKFALEFVKNEIGEIYQSMHPVNLANAQNGAYAMSDDLNEQILILSVGAEDTWDRSTGVSFSLNLSSINGEYTGQWFDPRSAEVHSAGRFSGGQSHLVSTPSTQDWVLWLTRE